MDSDRICRQLYDQCCRTPILWCHRECKGTDLACDTHCSDIFQCICYVRERDMPGDTMDFRYLYLLLYSGQPGQPEHGVLGAQV